MLKLTATPSFKSCRRRLWILGSAHSMMGTEVSAAGVPSRLAALLLLATLLLVRVGGQRSQKDLLLDFKDTFSNGYSILSSWGASPEPCDGSWLNVLCSNYGDVTGM